MQGFFQESELYGKQPEGLVPKCGSCGLLKLCKTPKMKVCGRGRRGILLVGEAPGEEEDNQGYPFVGKTGSYLKHILWKLGVDMRRDCWSTNALICRPPDNQIKDDNRIDYCRPNLIRTIKELQPSTIILLGARAVRSLIEHLWRDDAGGIYRWAGFQIPDQKYNAWVCPTFHPSHALRAKESEKHLLLLHLEQDLKKAVELKGRPWDDVPNYQDRVETCLDPNRAAKFLRFLAKRSELVAFDYETDTLKPDIDFARVVCCSASNGKHTLAYPWQGEAIEATRDLLRSPCPKIASNLKFEEGWSIARLGTRVRNWKFDTMLGAHCIDNRKGITSIKFQAFVLLGQAPWDDHVKPHLSADSSNQHNRIKDVRLEQLLAYCGMDSLMEYEVAKLMMRRIGL